MRRLVEPLVLATVVLLAGCEGAAPPASRGAALSASASAMEFRGERPCVDCNGIEAWLRLEQQGKAQHYRLIERYRSGERERRFEDEGEWQAEGDLLRLRSRDGGERVYARLADGALEARDAQGQLLPAAADDVMIPVTFDSAQ